MISVGMHDFAWVSNHLLGLGGRCGTAFDDVLAAGGLRNASSYPEISKDLDEF